MQDNASLEMALGMIVFGPMTYTLEGKAHTIDKLREAARLLEYRFAEQRREMQAQHGEIVAAEQDQRLTEEGDQLAPAKRKRRHRATNRSNGASPDPPPADPLFPPATTEAVA